MQLEKIKSYIGFAIKSKKSVAGLEMLLRLKKLPTIILYDEKIGNSSSKQIKFFNEVKNVVTIAMPENYLSEVTNKKNIKIISILDENLGNAIKNSLD